MPLLPGKCCMRSVITRTSMRASAANWPIGSRRFGIRCGPTVALIKKTTNLRRQIDTSDRNADMIAAELRSEEQDREGRVDGGGGAKKNEPGCAPYARLRRKFGKLVGKRRFRATQTRRPACSSPPNISADWKAARESNSTRCSRDANIKQAKSDFADYITTLYGSHRYYQVIIAADFYRQLFNEGDYPVAMANQVNASLEVNKQRQSRRG